VYSLLDFVHLMSYDFHGGFYEDATTRHHAPLRGNTGYPREESFNVVSIFTFLNYINTGGLVLKMQQKL